jgi:hypothetical protein
MFKNSRTAHKIYQKLTDDERNILESRTVDGKYTVKDWYRLLKHLALMDGFADKARKSYPNAFIASGIITFFTLIFAINAAGFVVGLIISLLPLGALGLTYYYYKTFKDIDLGNQLRLFIMPALNLLSHKVPRRAKIEMTLNLNPIAREENKVDEEVIDSPPEPHLKKKIHNYFQLPWLSAKILLKDGSLLVFTVEEQVRERKVVKYHKNKRKTKYKSKHTLRLKLAAPKKRYKKLQESNEQFTIEEDDKFIIITLKSKQVSRYNPMIPDDEEKSLDPRYLTQMLVDAYKCIEPVSPQQQSA